MTSKESPFEIVVNPSMDFHKKKDYTSSNNSESSSLSSPFESMISTSSALALQNTFIGNNNINNNSSPAPNSPTSPTVCYEDLVPYPPSFITTTTKRKSWFASPLNSKTSTPLPSPLATNKAPPSNSPHCSNFNAFEFVATHSNFKAKATKESSYYLPKKNHSPTTEYSRMNSNSLTMPTDFFDSESIVSESESVLSELSSFDENIPERISLFTVDQGTETDDLPGLRYSANLEGQVETLTEQLQSTVKEKLAFQSQISTLQTQLQGQTEEARLANKSKEKFRAELEKREREYKQWSSVIADYQIATDTKDSEIRALKEDISGVEFVNEKFKITQEETRNDLKSKETEVSSLNNKISELHVEVQMLLQGKVQLENEIKAIKGELLMSQKSRGWYQDQLHQAQEMSNRVHQELITSQTTQLKLSHQLENYLREKEQLKQELNDTVKKALKDKESLRKQLENIESDLLERESLFDQLKKDQTDEGLKEKFSKLEKEHIKLLNLSHKTSNLEFELSNLRQAFNEKVNTLQLANQERKDFLKKLTILQKENMEKDLALGMLDKDLKQQKQELQHTRLEAKSRQEQVYLLTSEKTSIEVALAAANEDKRVVTNALHDVSNNLNKVDNNVKQMKTDLINKSTLAEILSKEKTQLTETLAALESQLKSQMISYENSLSAENQKLNMLINDLESKNHELEKLAQIRVEDLQALQKQMTSKNQESVVLQNEVDALKVQLTRQEAKTTEQPDEKSKNLEIELEKLLRKQRAYRSSIKILTRKLGQKPKEVKSTPTQTEELPERDYHALANEQAQLKKQLEESQQLMISLEKEYGKLLSSHNQNEHLIKELKEELATKEVCLGQLREEMRIKEYNFQNEHQKIREKNSQLEIDLSKDQLVLKELRNLIFQEKRVNSQLKRQVQNFKNGLKEANTSNDSQTQELAKLQAELGVKLQAEFKHRVEMEQLQGDFKSQQNLIEQLEQELTETRSRQPALGEQIKTLGWHLKEKNNQLENIKQEVEIRDERQRENVLGLEKQILELDQQITALKQEIDSERKEKFYFKTRSAELRQALKMLVQQSNDKDIMNLTPAPLDKSSIFSLLEQSSVVPEARPLNNVQACLNSLKEELKALKLK